MQNARDVLTPDALAMLQRIASEGSFAAAARKAGQVPSALTYRVRQIEDALDVLLFDRSSRQARLTAAGAELLREGNRLLAEIDAVANRVKRVATGWEPQLTIAADGLIRRDALFDLAEAFFAQSPPTRLKLRDETLSGTLEALTSGQADLAIGVGAAIAPAAGLQMLPLGSTTFVQVMAPFHPLAQEAEPLGAEALRRHRAVAVADSVQRGGGVTIGLLDGQDVLTVPTLQAKLEALLRGLGVGSMPEPMVRAHLAAGRLVLRRLEQPIRPFRVSYAWRAGDGSRGRALQWWLDQLERPATRCALLENDRAGHPGLPAAPAR